MAWGPKILESKELKTCGLYLCFGNMDKVEKKGFRHLNIRIFHVITELIVYLSWN